jgi:peptide/nickel transport system ATP-binding protein/oligopeptide transport system ATP-binding protein
MPLLLVEEIRKSFRRNAGPPVRAVNGVSLAIEEGETLGLIGESGSGKSTVGRLVLGLLSPDSGRVEFAGRDLARLPARELRRLRADLQVIFQEPLESLDPRMRVGAIVEEPLIVHRREMSRAARAEAVIDMLRHVGLDETHAARYPGELSGGQQQRVGIARAIVTRPRFVVLDEPTSSLDLSVRASILDLLGRLQRELRLSYLFISHDIATVRYFCTRTAVMYLGTLVEAGDTETVLATPRHPYTKALLSATLSPDPEQHAAHMPLRGDIPSPTDIPPGCPLVGRCPIEIAACSAAPVPLAPISHGHAVACIRANDAAVA